MKYDDQLVSQKIVQVEWTSFRPYGALAHGKSSILHDAVSEPPGLDPQLRV